MWSTREPTRYNNVKSLSWEIVCWCTRTVEIQENCLLRVIRSPYRKARVMRSTFFSLQLAHFSKIIQNYMSLFLPRLLFSDAGCNFWKMFYKHITLAIFLSFDIFFNYACCRESLPSFALLAKLALKRWSTLTEKIPPFGFSRHTHTHKPHTAWRFDHQ